MGSEVSTLTNEYSVSGVSPPVESIVAVPICLPGRFIMIPVCGFLTFLPLVLMANFIPSLIPWLAPPAISVPSASLEMMYVFQGLFVHLLIILISK